MTTPDLASLPPPLVPADLDMDRFWWVKVPINKFLGSAFNVEVHNDGAWRAGVTLMLRSWQLVPAGSIPDDDRALARLAGVSLTRWRRMRADALKGWVLCSDGRLYHPLICQAALEARDEAERAAERRDRDRTRKTDNGDGGTSGGSGPTPAAGEPARNSDGNPAPTGQDKTGQDISPQSPRAVAGGSPRHSGFRSKRPNRADGTNPRAIAATAKGPEPTAEEALWRNRLKAGPARLWLDSWGPKPDEPGCMAPLVLVAASPWGNDEHRVTV